MCMFNHILLVYFPSTKKSNNIDEEDTFTQTFNYRSRSPFYPVNNYIVKPYRVIIVVTNS